MIRKRLESWECNCPSTPNASGCRSLGSDKACGSTVTTIVLVSQPSKGFSFDEILRYLVAGAVATAATTIYLPRTTLGHRLLEGEATLTALFTVTTGVISYCAYRAFFYPCLLWIAQRTEGRSRLTLDRQIMSANDGLGAIESDWIAGEISRALAADHYASVARTRAAHVHLLYLCALLLLVVGVLTHSLAVADPDLVPIYLGSAFLFIAFMDHKRYRRHRDVAIRGRTVDVNEALRVRHLNGLAD